MGAFEEQLDRLKAAMRVSEDKDIADLLGMTKAAFSARKARNSFPVDKLKALAADQPELRLDVKYVLTGVSDELERRLAALSTATKVAGRVADKSDRYAVQQEVFDAIAGALSQDEQRLVHCYRNTGERGRALLIATAVTLAADDVPAVAPQPPAKRPRKKISGPRSKR